jgi:hypothetical protein
LLPYEQISAADQSFGEPPLTNRQEQIGQSCKKVKAERLSNRTIFSQSKFAGALPNGRRHLHVKLRQQRNRLRALFQHFFWDLNPLWRKEQAVHIDAVSVSIGGQYGLPQHLP